jgi:hypothetical protein
MKLSHGVLHTTVPCLAAGIALTLGSVSPGSQIVEETIIHEAFPESVPLDPDAAQPPAVTPVSLDLQDAFQEGVNVFDLGPVTPERIAEAELTRAEKFQRVRPGPRRVGIVRAIAPVPFTWEHAEATVLEDGEKVWTLAIRSPEAFGTRLHFTGFDVGGGSLIVYSLGESGLVTRGPFSERGPQGRGDFWTALLPGDTVFLEATASDEPRFEITEIVHFDRDPAGLGGSREDGGDNGNAVFACHLDVMCYGEPPVDVTARKATGQMNFVSGGEVFVCTGTLLSDHDGETRVPYFLTAAHCLSTQAEVDTLMVTWFWRRDSCGGTLPDPATLPSNVGGTLLATTDENDMTFIRLAGELPPGSGLAGWTTETGLDEAVGIHHPGGSWKRVTFLSGVGTCPGCVCLDPTDFDYYDMDGGLVEGGSSGSGIFNYSGQLAGQLFGRCSDFSDPDDMNCGNIGNYWAVYGEFEETYPLIAYWLAIGGTMHVDGTAFVPPWNGTPAHPFRTVSQANSAAWDGLRIKIRTGAYPESLTISKQLTLIASGGTVTIGQ